jgi:tetratricopeptide (TPR) repeat protein
VERLRCDLDAARASYDRALARDPFDAGARAGLAEALFLDARPGEALAQVEQGLARRAARTDARLWRVKALALVELDRVDLAIDAARRAAELAPLDARCHEALARALFRAGDMDGSGREYRRAADIDPRTEEANLRLGNGFGPATAGRRWKDGPHAGEFLAAVSAFDAGSIDEAGREFEALCRVDPDSFKFRLGLGLCRVAIRRSQEVRFGGDAGATYALLPAPEMPRIGEVVKGYECLSEHDRHTVRVAVLPARGWWDALIASGATHEILPVEASLTDSEARADLRDRRTFDGRHYDHLRGVGGLSAATGVEKLREAAAFGFNTFAHEFAHQLLDHAFPPKLRTEVEALYAVAKLERRFLDYYAASNVDEYFAQGYEAFVSHAKRGCLKDTERHTRAELEEIDPGLYAFLGDHTDLSHETPESLAPFLDALRSPR